MPSAGLVERTASVSGRCDAVEDVGPSSNGTGRHTARGPDETEIPKKVVIKFKFTAGINQMIVMLEFIMVLILHQQ